MNKSREKSHKLVVSEGIVRVRKLSCAFNCQFHWTLKLFQLNLLCRGKELLFFHEINDFIKLGSSERI